MKNKEKLFWIGCAVLLFVATVIIPILILFEPLEVHAETYNTPFRMESTAYCYGEITASGQRVRTGIAAAKKDWIGLTAVVYEDDNGEIGELIGIYEILDTGADYRIKNGTCIDIYMESYEDAINYGRKKVWVLLVDAKR